MTMNKIAVVAAGLIVAVLLIASQVQLCSPEAPLWILKDAGKTIYIFETIRLV
jgi:hypothetical protein